jgi:hypothetical protein
MIGPTANLVLHAVTAGLIVLLVVSSIVGILVLIQHWHRVTPERKRGTRRWLLTVGLCAIAIASWGELVSGSTSLSSAFVCLGITFSYASALWRHRKPSAWEQTPPNGVFPSLWELASRRYRVGVTAIIALTLSAGVGMLAVALAAW